MKKRLTSLLLALVMVLLCVPTWVMPAAAAEAAAAEKSVYVRFRLADAREYGYTGTVVSETAMAPGFASIVYPTDLQLLSYGIKPSDVLGWYHIQPDGTFVDASAYNGVYISEDLNFYQQLGGIYAPVCRGGRCRRGRSALLELVGSRRSGQLEFHSGR